MFFCPACSLALAPPCSSIIELTLCLLRRLFSFANPNSWSNEFAKAVVPALTLIPYLCIVATKFGKSCWFQVWDEEGGGSGIVSRKLSSSSQDVLRKLLLLSLLFCHLLPVSVLICPFPSFPFLKSSCSEFVNPTNEDFSFSQLIPEQLQFHSWNFSCPGARTSFWIKSIFSVWKARAKSNVEESVNQFFCSAIHWWSSLCFSVCSLAQLSFWESILVSLWYMELFWICGMLVFPQMSEISFVICFTVCLLRFETTFVGRRALRCLNCLMKSRLVGRVFFVLALVDQTESALMSFLFVS